MREVESRVEGPEMRREGTARDLGGTRRIGTGTVIGIEIGMVVGTRRERRTRTAQARSEYNCSCCDDCGSLSSLFYRSSKHRETSAEREERKAEKRTRRSAEAALTLPMRQAVAETSFYSSTDNPFHDANLGDQFVWGKKKEKEKKQGMTPEEARRRDIERHLESQVSCWFSIHVKATSCTDTSTDCSGR